MPDHETPFVLPEKLDGVSVHLVGAKGTGVCALAELLCAGNARVTGSDVDEVFYTDEILADLGVPVSAFSADALPDDTAFVVRSAAYDVSNPVVAEALQRGIPIATYPEVLGALSLRYDSTAIAGVHGKTTTTALLGTLCRALEIPATVLVGSAVSGFGNRSTWSGGGRFLIAETCEYRRHFLNFHPKRIVLTSVEPDHQDYYPDYESIRDAFVGFVLSLPENGELIFCQDDAGARDVVDRVRQARSDIFFTPYGEAAAGPWRVSYGEPESGVNRFRVASFNTEFELSLPGRHIALDAVAALALVHSLKKSIGPATVGDSSAPDEPISSGELESLRLALKTFRGSRRRSEIVGERDGILVMDDYAHHPTAIRATLQGLKEFHPDRRLVVDFMPHTYSRTAALLDDFAHSFADADVLILHDIYGSAREHFEGKLSGRDLYDKAAAARGEKPTLYHEELRISEASLPEILCEGDLFITLGAGNNWPLGRHFLGV